MDKLKLNLGCGTDIKKDYINLDIVSLNGIALVADLGKAPYPFKNDVFDEILMWHVLEHLPDIVITMEELHRISKPGCNVHIAVPYWNSYGAVVDPTHKSFFHHKTFDYFDPSKQLNQSKGYYTRAKFKIKTISYICELKLLEILQRLISVKNQRGNYKIPNQLQIKNRFLKWVLEMFAHYFCNIINGMEIELKTIKKG